MNFVFEIIKLIRPFNITIAIFSSLIVFQLYPHSSIKTLFQLILVLIFYMAAGNILNDYLDVKTDKINKPHRILVKYEINNYVILLLIAMLFIAGTTLAMMQSYITFCIATYIAMPFIILYELIFKKIPLIGNIVISFLVGLVFIFIESGIIGDIVYTWKIMFLAFGLNLIREIIKDIEDIKGDKKSDYATLPISIGVKKTIFIIRMISATFIFFSVSPIYIFAYNFIYFPLIFFLIHLPLLYIMWRLNDNITSSEYHFFSSLLKAMIFCGVLIILLSH